MMIDAMGSFSLNDGRSIPKIGLGTFGSDRYNGEQIADAVRFAGKIGFRHFDCAAVYGNEKEVGKAINDLIQSGVPRSDLWITGKVWNNRHHDAHQACLDSLADLNLDYFDLYLIHWPFPNHHDPGCDVGSRSASAKPFIVEDYLSTWRQLETLKSQGYAKSIGTSNMTVAKFEAFLPHVSVIPAANEMELHPHFQQPEFFDYLASHQIQPIGFSPLGSPSRPERDRTDEDSSPLDDLVILDLAKIYQSTPAQICIKWAIQRGQVTIPFSTKEHQIKQILDAVAIPDFTPAELDKIANIDRNCRLIKGQVFLWRDDQSWEDLWDLDGRTAQR